MWYRRCWGSVHIAPPQLPQLLLTQSAATSSLGTAVLVGVAAAKNNLRTGQVFADQRYQRHDKRDKLPGWITSHLRDAHLNLSTDMLLHVAREFMRSMAQPYDRLAIGKSLLTEEQANALGAPAAPMLS